MRLTRTTLLLALVALSSSTKTKRNDQQTKKLKDLVHKRQAVCGPTEFDCGTGSCTSSTNVCDTVDDCWNGKDEENCPTDCSGPNQFKCQHDGKCISRQKQCDGPADCSDWSDEANCANFECREGFVHCLNSLECIRESYRCDGSNDCRDGSDERDCPHTGTCSPTQFTCAQGGKQCVSQTDRCDGYKDCTDNSDELGCSCNSNQFQCSNSVCIPGNWKCDGDNDCGDGSDELSCPTAPASQCSDVLDFISCFHWNTTSHPVCGILQDAHKYCRKYCQICNF